MKKVIILFSAVIFIACNGSNKPGSAEGTDSSSVRLDSGGTRNDNKIDSASAALPTDTAPYKRNPNDSVVRPNP